MRTPASPPPSSPRPRSTSRRQPRPSPSASRPRLPWRAMTAPTAELTAADPTRAAADPMPTDLVELAGATKGFLPPTEALALYDAAWAVAPYGVVLEVGTYCGKSATYLGAAARARGGTVVTVDHHRGSEE